MDKVKKIDLTSRFQILVESVYAPLTIGMNLSILTVTQLLVNGRADRAL